MRQPLKYDPNKATTKADTETDRGKKRRASAKQAAQYLGLSVATLLRKARKGTIPSDNLSAPDERACWRFDLDEIDTWLEAKRTGR